MLCLAFCYFCSLWPLFTSFTSLSAADFALEEFAVKKLAGIELFNIKSVSVAPTAAKEEVAVEMDNLIFTELQYCLQ